MKSRVRSIVRASDVIIAMVALIAVLLAACTGGETTDEPEAATTTSIADTAATPGEQPELQFGSGELPATVPADFPFPNEAVIGSTMIDRTRDLTEVVVVYPANVPEVVEYFEANLPVLGYTLDASSGTDANWIIEFSSDGSTGELRLSVGGAGLTQGTLRIVTPVSG